MVFFMFILFFAGGGGRMAELESGGNPVQPANSETNISRGRGLLELSYLYKGSLV